MKNVLLVHVFVVGGLLLNFRIYMLISFRGKVYWSILFYMLISVRNLIVRHSFLRRIKCIFIYILGMCFKIFGYV